MTTQTQTQSNGSSTWIPPQGNSSQWGSQRPVTLTSTATSYANGSITFNAGASLPDTEAIGPESQPLSQWQKAAGIDPSKQVKIVKLAHMRYQHPDLEEITTFMRDFGMHIVQTSDHGNEGGKRRWFRGYGSDQYVYYAQSGPKKFLGGTFEVESLSELEKATAIPGAAEEGIQKLDDAPGGGHMLTLTDPEGFMVNLLYGQEAAPTGDFPEKVIVNDEVEKPRVRKFNRFTPGPAAVHKLGHYGLCVQDFDEQLKWYTRNFNLAPTDFLYVPDGGGSKDGGGGKKDVAAFLHIDRGADPVDHHTFFMSTNKTSHVHHCSFEVHDYDTQHLGHQWLGGKGYTSVWGIGRHILGSQIFDYWWDTTGNMVEHYADGDLVNHETPVGWSDAKDESLAVWGPEVSKWFLE
ncbi:hypothetical protein LTR78_006712 [Recurvomyces mirabilis]|uniref:VOC domain-containing protein n=1 Tax=Recurvomyces mirabilis TaxID=574656 RepID=A0AAE1BZS0_9PEZI|nr:hypothetical protein LTR78_006712 [Recurvomyces mirabilis]KAK5151399.1 hypothetical protein LTS14_009242 [Recurvomyces mirabilis]